MFPKAIIQERTSALTYKAKIGEITDGKLMGYGKILSVNEGHTEALLGRFENDLLEGVGVSFSGKSISGMGLYAKGKPININEFLAKANKKIIPELKNHNYTFVDAILYYLGNDPEKINGPTILLADEVIVYFISGNKREKGQVRLARLEEYENGKPVGLFVEEFIDKDGRAQHSFEHHIDSRPLSILFDRVDADAREFEWKEMTINDGVKAIKSGSLTLNTSVILHLPKSVAKLEDKVFNSGGPFFVEVFYDGTIEEWKAIEKGKEETVTEEDWYGYYYHNAERYSTYTKTIPWSEGADFVLIHCSDGDLTE